MADSVDVVPSDSNTLRISSAEEGQLRTQQRVAAQNHIGKVIALAFSSDFQWIASAGWESKIVLRKAAHPSINTQQVAGTRALALVFCPSGTRLASVHQDGFRVWTITYGGPNQETVDLMLEEILHTRSDECTPRAVAWLDEERLATVCSVSGKAPKTRNQSAVPGRMLVSECHDALNFALFSPDNTLLVFGGAGGRCHIWDITRQTMKLAVPAHDTDTDNPVVKTVLKAAQFDAKGEIIVVLSDDGTARIWDTTQSGRLLFTVSNKYCVRDVSLSPDGTRLLIVLDDGRALLSEWRNSVMWPETLAGRHSAVQSMCFSPTGKSIAFALSNSTVCISDGETRGVASHPRVFTEHEGRVTLVVFSGDDILVFATEDDTMHYITIRDDSGLGTSSEDADCKDVRFKDKCGEQRCRKDEWLSIPAVNAQT
ncbi:hypothetical protein TRAPUB_1324 [Trametes pubescens]|uniref:Uncharacterized protein n=1 Tax=Trametes pubescens TaxID=154538 RepID=A0A1M2VJI2_TRAPU|nr:hypothetical protein TRAPUB_1324 [Trametes pubescens]